MSIQQSSTSSLDVKQAKATIKNVFKHATNIHAGEDQYWDRITFDLKGSIDLSELERLKKITGFGAHYIYVSDKFVETLTVKMSRWVK